MLNPRHSNPRNRQRYENFAICHSIAKIDFMVFVAGFSSLRTILRKMKTTHPYRPAKLTRVGLVVFLRLLRYAYANNLPPITKHYEIP